MRIKQISVILMILILGFVFPFSALAETVNSIDFSDIEKQMSARNPLIIKNNNSYDDVIKAKENGMAGIDILLNQWSLVNTAYGAGDATSLKDQAAIRYLLDIQKAALDQQKSTYSGMSNMNTLITIEKGNNTIIWSMEMLYISYNSVSCKLNDLIVKKTVAEKQVQIFKLQKEMGMVTDLTVSDAENTLLGLESSIQDLTESKKSMMQQFNVNLGQEYDVDISIGEVPVITAVQISKINVNEDYLIAKGKSYDLMLDSNSSDAQRKFKSNFYRTYQTIIDKQKALLVEQSRMATAESKWKIAQLKYKLGLISQIQYEAEGSNYMSQKTSTKIAQYTFTQAYRQYEWAKRGLIVNSNTSSM
ncbi:TolC family protein [Dehalobacter restrictus]|uniref:TolC family protein n=1 Tax=Dehalobacter restrictus TaxID=55583 RepID=UPI00338DC14C